MIRLFAGLRPSAATRSLLLGRMHGVAGARWQSDAQLHLTLAFIGEVSERTAEAVDAALSSISAPRLSYQVQGVGSFTRKDRPHSLWAGIVPAAPVTALATKVETACRKAGADIQRRAFVPHITLARLNAASGPVEDFLSTNSALSGPGELADAVILFESRLGREGSTYHELARYPLF
jgi:2'-5' RNA ligase